MIRRLMSPLSLTSKNRMFCTSPVEYQSRGLMKLKKLQADYQVPIFNITLDISILFGFAACMYNTSPIYSNNVKYVTMSPSQKFPCEDGRPVWLKAGFRDRVLYSTTIVLSLAGLFLTLSAIYDLGKPPSWKQKTC